MESDPIRVISTTRRLFAAVQCGKYGSGTEGNEENEGRAERGRPFVQSWIAALIELRDMSRNNVKVEIDTDAFIDRLIVGIDIELRSNVAGWGWRNFFDARHLADRDPLHRDRMLPNARVFKKSVHIRDPLNNRDPRVFVAAGF